MRYQLIIQYDGSQFHGWQVQAKGRTVQGDIEKALSKIYSNNEISLMGAGRTDAGVHAMAQVAHVELSDHLSSHELQQALNGNLKRDVRIDSVREVDRDFHARFSAKAREYEYHLVKHYSPINRHYVADLKWKVDIELLHECAKEILGQHDFSSFCKSTSEVENKICHVLKADWKDEGDKLFFIIRANRFLQHMVRYLVGTMLEVARGKNDLFDFMSLIKNDEKRVKVVRAPAKGLFLKKVYYE